VTLHGGEMSIVSNEGVGTTVSVFFPTRPAHLSVVAA
jgi:signal transduction histidine kinase